MKKKYRLLLVEDESAIREAYSELFRLRGYEVEGAEDGADGVAKAQSWQPDVILMDIRMPVMNGIEAIRVLRDQPHTADLLIFALTAHTDEKTCAAAEAAGADGIFAKPPDLKLIDNTVREILLEQEVIV